MRTQRTAATLTKLLVGEAIGECVTATDTTEVHSRHVAAECQPGGGDPSNPVELVVCSGLILNVRVGRDDHMHSSGGAVTDERQLDVVAAGQQLLDRRS